MPPSYRSCSSVARRVRSGCAGHRFVSGQAGRCHQRHRQLACGSGSARWKRLRRPSTAATRLLKQGQPLPAGRQLVQRGTVHAVLQPAMGAVFSRGSEQANLCHLPCIISTSSRMRSACLRIARKPWIISTC